MILCGMVELCRIILGAVVDLFRPRAALEAEILVLRQQIVLRRGRPSRVPFLAIDRMVLDFPAELGNVQRQRPSPVSLLKNQVLELMSAVSIILLV